MKQTPGARLWLAALFFAVLPLAQAQSNAVLREVFRDIGSGATVADLTSSAKFIANTPDEENLVTSLFEAPTDVLENYGQRLRALITAPSTGPYTFWVASDDASDLFLSTDATPANKARIASVASWTGSREWTKEANQQSAPISLTAGQRYYIEVLMKEGGGGDNLAVRWLRPGGVDEAPINLTNCVPYGLGAPVITTQPANATVAEGASATFNVMLARSLGATYQWHSNGVRIAGATNATFTVSPATLIASNSTYFVGVTNSYGGTNSNLATLNVTPDTTRPTMATVSALDPNVVTVLYSEPVEAATATNLANYAVTGGITLQGARFGADTRTVILSVAPLAGGVTYTLTVNNVRDRATTPNTILANSTRTFSLNSQPLPIGYLFPGPEPIGPSRRRSPLVISEVMYNPTNRVDLRNLEFIEIYNSQAWSEDISGYEISGEVNYTFPASTVIAARSYLAVAGNPADFVAGYGGGTPLGPFVNTNKLNNSSGTVRLKNDRGAVLVEFNYRNDPPWPLAAAGAGHSMVLARPSYGEDDPRAWAASVNPGGSPRVAEPAPITTFNTILINEVLAHTDLPQEDYIELYNYSTVSVNIGGLALTDDPNTNKFTIPGGTLLGPRSFLAFTETQLGFALNNDGETLFLRTGQRTVDAVKYEGQENGKPWGRYPDGTPAFHALRNATQGTNNTALYVHDIVLNEIMYAPASGNSDDEFIELKNKGTNTVNVGGWKFSAGITFTMPASVTIPAGGYLVVAKNAARLRTNYVGLTTENCLGDYSGTLANGGERVALSFPDDVATTNQFGQPITNKIWIVADEVTYGDGGRWGRSSDAGGSSLELVDARSDNRLASNWRDSDESQKSPWVTLEWTGTLDNGNGGLDRLHLFLLGEGECLVDNVEAIQGGTDRISNGNFEGGQTGWTFQGTHVKSFIENSGGFGGSKGLHVVASARGDTGANRIWTATTTAFTGGQTATLRAKVRFLRGHPELLLRIKGAWLEASTNHIATKQFGTPGAVNSATLAAGGNVGPALADVKHTPVLPVAGQAVTVSARVSDPDGLSSLILNYRLDPATNYTALAMTNNGAGYYSALSPGQADATMIAFFLQASDNGTPLGTTLFPNDAPTREGLIRWGEPQPTGTLGQYHIWISAATANYWNTREKNSNEPLDCSFVYGTNRVIYNGQTLYAGSPWHAPGFSGPLGGICDYVFRAPDDDPLLGHDDFALASPGNLNSDPAYMREQMAFFVLRQLGEPYLYRRFVRLYVNGQQRGTLYEDTQQPGGDWAEQWFPDDPNGDLHKIEDWFEFDDTGNSFNFNVDATLQNFTTDGGAKKLARYRWNWRKRAVQGSANNYTNLFSLVDALNSTGPAYDTLVPQWVDLGNWARVSVLQRIVGNWDAYTMGRGKNCYAYKPDDADRAWKLCPWDIDFVFDNGGNAATDGLFGAGDPIINTLQGWAPFRREMYCAYAEAANQILTPTVFDARVDAIYNGLVSEGIALDNAAGLKSYVGTRRTTILGDLAANATAPMAVTLNGGADFPTNRNLIQITGTAPVGVKDIRINGIAQNVTWTGVNTWTLFYTLNSGANALNLTGEDRNHVTFTNDTISITYTGPAETPQDKLVINEIMYNPLAPNAAYLELWNRSAQNAFDLSNWKIEGVDFTFPDGTFIEAGQYKVIVANTAGFQAAFGAGLTPLGEWNGTLDNGGETLTLWQWVATPTTTNYVMVDQVCYDDVAPWSAAADGFGASLQLIDATRDNRRVANWGIGSTNVLLIPTQTLVRFTNLWRYNQTADLTAVNWTAAAYDDSAWPQGLGLLYVETAALPEPKNTALTIGRSTYYFRGGFNFTGTPGQYQLRLRHVVDDGLVIYLNGVELYRLGVPAGQGYGTGADRTVSDAGYEGPFILSAANLATGTNVLAVEVHQVNTTSSDVVMGLELIAEPLSAGGGVALYSPAAPNSVAAAHPDFPTVWLNELQTYNTAGPADRFGDRDPWVELYNAGTNTIDLSTSYLTDSYTNLTRWPFPAGTMLAPGAFRIVWLDGEPAETGAGELHASFRTPLTTGTVALVTLYNGTNTVMDYYNWDFSSPNRSLGSFPDGNPCQRRSLAIVTPGATNNPAFPPVAVFVNEWLAQNSATLPDPVDGQFEDWIELYNAELSPVDLGGYYLTDALTNKTKWKIPDNTVIPAQGFLLVWADNENSQNNDTNSDRHANFQLAAGGEEIGLFTDTGLQVDAVVFGPQLNDVSQGRYPDGSPSILLMTNRTPRAANFIAGSANQAPVLTGLGNRSAIEGQTLAFTATATDPNISDALTFTLDAGAPAGASITSGGAFTWVPTEAQGGANYNVTVRVTDNGSPSLNDFETLTITVLKTNSAPALNVINNQNVVEQQLLTFTATAGDPDQPAQILTFTLDPGAPAGAVINTNGVFTWTPTEAQGTNSYSIVVRVTDDGEPARSSFQAVILFVAESNQAPVLAAIGNKSVSQGQALNFTLSATDADLPVNTLTYSMSGAPAGATLNTNSGAFAWSPTNSGTFNVIFSVQDNGVPVRTDNEAVQIVVTETNAPPTLTVPTNLFTVVEGALLTFTNTASDANSGQVLSFTLGAGAPAGAAVNPTNGVFIWTATEAQGPSSNSLSILVSDNGTPALSATQFVSILVLETNSAPVLAAIGNRGVAEGVQLAFTATATDADVPGNALVFTLAGGAPAGAAITTGGNFTWTPTEAQGPGVYDVTIIVTDNEIPALIDSETIQITVSEANQPPSVTVPTNSFVVIEGSLLSFNATGSDNDVPAQTLAFSLAAGAPSGAAITGGGAFTWTPAEAQGPFTNSIGIVVTDNGSPNLAATQFVTVVVLETNASPTLTLATNFYTVVATTPLSFVANGADADLPVNTLTYSLTGAPSGAGIGANSGVFNWTPAAGQAPGTNIFSVLVADNGVPSRSATQAITVVVTPFTGPQQLVSITNVWRYQPDGADLGTTWSSTNYNDTAWPQGAGLLYVETAALPAPTNTALTLTGTNGTQVITYYFRTHFTFSGSPLGVQLIASNVIDDGAVFYLNGVEAGRFNLSAAPVRATNFADGVISEAVYTFTNLNAAALRQGDNVLAVEVHQVSLGSSDIVFGMSLHAILPTNSPIVIVTQPTNQTVVVNSSAALTVVATGTAPQFQWFKDGVPISGANSGTFSLASAQLTNAGTYFVVVSNSVNSVASSNAVLTVLPPANNPPVLAPIGNRTVVEGAPLSFTATANDPQSPPQTLTFSLDAGAPTGAAISGAGTFNWTPTEAQGPGSYNLTIRVTDNGSPALDDSETITVTVLETNAAPVLAALTNRTVVPGDYLTYTNTATDADLPLNRLTYSLGAGAPVNASIVPLTGLFAWAVPTNQPAGTNSITVVVTDDGTPARSQSQAFNVIVSAPLRITSVVEAGGNMTITAVAIPGRRYTLATKTDLGVPGGWNAVGTNQTAPGATVSFSTPVMGVETQRFYRVLLLP